MSRHYDTQLRIRDSLVNRVKQVYHEAMKYHHPHSWILQRIRETRIGDWARATTQTKEYVRGFERAMFDSLYEYPDSKLVMAYDVDGVRYTIDSLAYKALSPRYVHEHHTWGGHVWRANISCNFSEGARNDRQ